MREFTVYDGKGLIKSNINKKFRFKIHYQIGPGFHTEFVFSVNYREKLHAKKGYIKIQVKPKIFSIYERQNIPSFQQDEVELLIKPFEAGVKKIVDLIN